MKVLVLTSTFPANPEDAAPGFVRDQVIALKRCDPRLELSVLAPHYRNETASVTEHEHFTEYRFTYAFPRRLQRLAGRGIVPTLEGSPFMLALVPFLFLFEFAAVLKLVRKIEPDVLYAHWFTPQGVVAALASIFTDIPYVLTTHANDVRIWQKVPVLGRLIVRSLLPRATRITAVSEVTRDRMSRFFSTSEWAALRRRIAVIPMGVDTAALKRKAGPPERLGSGKASGAFVILFLGRLAEKKGVAYLIDAVAQIASPDIRLVVAGDGPLKPSLETRAEKAGIGSITLFPGYVTGAEKLSWLRLADVVVVPSIETSSGDAEGFPVVVIEALAAERICIVTDATGTSTAIRHAETGFVVPQKNADALAKLLASVQTMEESRKEEVRAAAGRAAARFDWSIIAEGHHRFLFADAPPC